MTQEEWSRVDTYYVDLLGGDDDALRAACVAGETAGLPAIAVSENHGKLLQLLVRSTGARRVLEIGTLAAYSTIWMAKGLPGGGRLVTLEADAHHAEVARGNISAAGLAGVVELRLGRAAETLRQMIAAGEAPFDFIFIDADKPSYPDYFTLSLRLAHPGTLIFADNVVRRGAIVDPESDNAQVQGVRRMNELVAAEPRVTATAVQTVGSKGYDGFLLMLVN